MRILAYALLVIALPAQARAQAAQPHWMVDLQSIYEKVRQAPLGSLDGQVEQAWRAAFEEPLRPRFPAAAQMVSSFYQSQGYDLKAEQILLQALAAVPEQADPQIRRNLTLHLAGHLESIQQLVKAAAIREQLAKEPAGIATNRSGPSSHETSALARLYERMGEFEKAEEAWREIAEWRAAGGLQKSSASGPRMRVGDFTAGYPRTGRNELADFYARHARVAEAEKIYKTTLDSVAGSSSPYEWVAAVDGYVEFLSQQRRFDEAVALTRQIIVRIGGVPDPPATQMLLNSHQRLARLLVQAGRPGEALAVQKSAVEVIQNRNPGGPEHLRALGALAETFVNQNRLEEAEKAVMQMREAAAADVGGAQFHESMTVQMLARIRDIQGNPEEARELRASVGVPDITAANRAATVGDVVGSVQKSVIRGNADVAVAAAGEALALAAERVHIDPREVSALLRLASILRNKQQKELAQRIAFEALRVLEQVPDHPWVADALGSCVSNLAYLGLTAEAERAIERQEKILLNAKGAESMALNSVSHGRIALLQRESKWAEVIDERERVLARTAKATGSNSRESLYALREVAWAYSAINNWPQEERVLSTLRKLTVRFSGESSLDHVHVLQHTANRASQNRQFGQALIWMDQAIEIARTLPDAGNQVEGMLQNRARIAQAKDAPSARPLPGPFVTPPNRVGGWFDSNRFHDTGGMTIRRIPMGVVSADQPAVVRDETPAAPGGGPAPAKP